MHIFSFAIFFSLLFPCENDELCTLQRNWLLHQHSNNKKNMVEPFDSNTLFDHIKIITVEPHYQIRAHTEYFSLVLSVSGLGFSCAIVPTQKLPHKGTNNENNTSERTTNKLHETINMFVINIFELNGKINMHATRDRTREREREK